uniref:2'-phosphotransferase n=1 Tax=Elaeis guineensis var. tenera TaxID=51953 RepID=A0A8N4FA15_ELAGV|nr:uncharacterized protein LOC105054773 isoform X1 [Elaeis guineensis]
MWPSATSALRVLRFRPPPPPPPISRSSCSSYPNLITTLFPSTLPLYPRRLLRMANPNPKPTAPNLSSSSKPFSAASISASSTSRRSGRGRGRGRDSGFREDRHRGRGGGADGDSNRIDALGRLMTRILRHMASELNLDIRSDGYVRVRDLLKLNMTTYAKVPLRSHTIEEVKEAVKRDNKQRFSLLEDNGELLIRANQGHTIADMLKVWLFQPWKAARWVLALEAWWLSLSQSPMVSRWELCGCLPQLLWECWDKAWTMNIALVVESHSGWIFHQGYGYGAVDKGPSCWSSSALGSHECARILQACSFPVSMLGHKILRCGSPLSVGVYG